MRIAIDIDDTITNTKEKQIIFWKKFYNENKREGYSETLPENINLFGDEYIELFWNTHREELARNVTKKENVSEVIKKLREKHEIIILTARTEPLYNDLRGLLKEQFESFDLEYDSIITNIRDKGKYMFENDIDIIIDDTLSQVESAIRNGKKGILFNDISGYDGYKTTNWLDVLKIIEEIEE